MRRKKTEHVAGVAEVLRGAADRLEREGWYPGDSDRCATGCFEAHTGPTCAGYAIWSCGGTRALAHAAQRALVAHLGLAAGGGLVAIGAWNDGAESKGVVLKALRDCAAACSEHEVQETTRAVMEAARA